MNETAASGNRKDYIFYHFWKQTTDFDLSTKVYQANLYPNGGEVHLAYEMENGKPVLTCHTDATGEANLFFEPADLPFTRSGMIWKKKLVESN